MNRELGREAEFDLPQLGDRDSGARRALIGVLRQHPTYEQIQRRWQGWRYVREAIGMMRNDGEQHCGCGRAVEREVTRGHLVEEHAEAE